MTAARLKPDDPTLLDCFRARCEARAVLVACGEISFHDAVDEMHQAAEADGLGELLGWDFIQSIMNAAFAQVPR